MPKCKAIHYLAVTTMMGSFLIPESAGAEAVPYKEYMMCKRDPSYCASQQPVQQYYGTEAYRQQPVYAAPAQPVYQQPVYQQPIYQPQQQYMAMPPALPPQQQYAMRPPAPYYDTAVPQETQKAAKKTSKKKTKKQKAAEAKRQPTQQPVYSEPMPVQPLQQYSQPQYTPPPAYVPPAQPAPADEKILGGNITGSLGLTTDYTFRGVSQSRENPAIQGGIEYQHDIGAYIGLWGSNVDFRDSDEAQAEFDVYGGYRTALTDDISADIGVIYYAYPGANELKNYDYVEVYASAEYSFPVGLAMGSGFDIEKASVGLGVNYSPENFGESGQATYVKATAAAPFANGITLDGHIGKQWVEDNAAFALPDYMDWSVGVAYALPKQFEAKLQYIGTNIDEDDCADGCDGKAVATLSKSF